MRFSPPLLVAAVLANACSSADPAPSAGEAGGGEAVIGSDPELLDSGLAGDSGNPYLAEESIVPLLSAAEVGEGIGTAIASVLVANPKVVIDAEAWMLAATGADSASGCPIDYADFYETYGYHYYYGPCEADAAGEWAGASYDGYAYWQHYTDWWSGPYLYSEYGYVYGTQSFVAPGGETFDLGGYAYYADYSYADYYHYFSAYVYGSVSWSGAAFSDTWISRAGTSGKIEASYSLSGGRYADGLTYLTVDGTVGGFEGPANAADFDALYLFDAGLGSNCPQEPSGAVAVRDSEGEWYTVEFDGPAFSGGAVFPDECDGCGEIWYRGEVVGEACPDFSPLDGWGDEGPWN